MNYKILIPILLTLVISCKKEDQDKPVTVPPRIVNAGFYTKKDCHSLVLPDSVQFIDSSLNFINVSDTGSMISYSWNFGDNTFSSLKDVSHTYSLPGKYKARLITLYNKVPTDTADLSINILIGQRRYKKLKFNKVVDAAVTTDDGVMVITSGYNTYNDPLSYAMLLTDSLLNQKWLRPVESARLSSIQRISTKEYLLSGNYAAGNTNQYAISKLNVSGDHLWTRFISDMVGNNASTIETADKGIITIGAVGVNTGHVAIVKLDVNGYEVWRKIFKDIVSHNVKGAINIIATDTSYVFAAINDSTSDLVLTRLNLNGEITKQEKIPLSGSTGTPFGVGIEKTSAGYLVNIVNSFVGYFFDNNLIPTSFKQIGNSSVNSIISWNDFYYTAEGNHQFSYIRKLDTKGTAEWDYPIRNHLILSCNSVSRGSTRYARVIKKGLNDFVAFSDGEDDQNGFSSSSIYIERISLTGQLR